MAVDLEIANTLVKYTTISPLFRICAAIKFDCVLVNSVATRPVRVSIERMRPPSPSSVTKTMEPAVAMPIGDMNVAVVPIPSTTL